LLFTQLSVAAYACPQFDNVSPVASNLVIDADMPGCQGMQRDQEAPNLCATHCDDAAQSADTPSAPTVPPFIQAALSVVLIQGEGLLPVQVSPDRLLHARPGSPPLIIRNCCFRI
jgi:hypothetical protein